MQGKLLHIVGGGYNQVPLVQCAKTLGLRVLVTDMFQNPPCKPLADLYEQIDTTDKEKTYRASVNHRIDAIVTDQTDVAVPTVAYVAEKLKLPGIGYETALRFTNKYLMREELKKRLPESIPEFHFFHHPQEAIAFCDQQKSVEGFLAKPINSQGSKGVFRLNNKNYKELLTHTFMESKGRGILLESYLEGFEYSVESFKFADKVHSMALTKKYHYNSNDCIDERNTWLGDISPELEKSLFELNEKVILALQLPFGITHGEYKLSQGRPFLIEIAARGGGGSISSKIVPYLTSFEPARALLQILFGHAPEIEIGDYKNRFAVLRFFNFRPGKIRKMHISKPAVANLLEFNLDIKDGGIVKPVLDSRDRPGYFVAIGTDRQWVLNKEKEVLEGVQIEYDNFQKE